MDKAAGDLWPALIARSCAPQSLTDYGCA